MKKLLSIDGGGIRGIIPALVLAEIEKRTNQSIASMFDLLGGTSTGGIICLALSRNDGQGHCKYGAADLAGLYENHGREIFHRSFWKGVSSVRGLTDEKYSHEALEQILRDYLEEDILEDALTKVLITSYDIEKRSPFFFKSWRDNTKSILMRHAARATSAAPTYFEPALLSVNQTQRVLVDGGVYINNPAMSVYAEAKRLFPEDESVLVVSLGTGELTRPITYEEAKDWGLAHWAIPILNVVFDGVSDAVDYQLRQLLGSNFFRFQTELDTGNDDMDDASRRNIEALKIEAAQILQAQSDDIETVCSLLTSGT